MVCATMCVSWWRTHRHRKRRTLQCTLRLYSRGMGWLLWLPDPDLCWRLACFNISRWIISKFKRTRNIYKMVSWISEQRSIRRVVGNRHEGEQGRFRNVDGVFELQIRSSTLSLYPGLNSKSVSTVLSTLVCFVAHFLNSMIYDLNANIVYRSVMWSEVLWISLIILCHWLAGLNIPFFILSNVSVYQFVLH